MSKSRILIQLDSDPQPSVFDGVVAVDAGAEYLFRHGNVDPASVRELVFGAMFTRGPEDLKHTALFIGGSNLSAGEAILAAVRNVMFEPLRVSVMLDSNGANTTAAAAVLAATKHETLAGAEALVLAATGPVGTRVVRLLASEGARVRVASRTLEKAEAACQALRNQVPTARLSAVTTATPAGLAAALQDATLVISAGAPGVELLSMEARHTCNSLRVAIDLSAVPPLGIAGVKMTDKAQEREGVICYGALGVGGMKMKIHKAAIRQLFEMHGQVLDAEEIYTLAKQL